MEETVVKIISFIQKNSFVSVGFIMPLLLMEVVHVCRCFSIQFSPASSFNCSMILMTMKEAPQGAETGKGRRRGTGTEREIVRETGTETKIGAVVGIKIGIGTVIVTTEITETRKEVIEGNVIVAEMMIMNVTVVESMIGDNSQSHFPVIFFPC